MHTININVVRDRSYENFSTQKFIIQKFPNTKISKYMVIQLLTVLPYAICGICTFFSLHLY